MAARTTFKISDEVRDVLARSTITETSVKLPPGQLERKLYEQVNKALTGSGGRWDRGERRGAGEVLPGHDRSLAASQGSPVLSVWWGLQPAQRGRPQVSAGQRWA